MADLVVLLAVSGTDATSLVLAAVASNGICGSSRDDSVAERDSMVFAIIFLFPDTSCVVNQSSVTCSNELAYRNCDRLK